MPTISVVKVEVEGEVPREAVIERVRADLELDHAAMMLPADLGLNDEGRIA